MSKAGYAAARILKLIRSTPGLEGLTDDQVWAVKRFCRAQTEAISERIIPEIYELHRRSLVVNELGRNNAQSLMLIAGELKQRALVPTKDVKSDADDSDLADLWRELSLSRE